jgi:hypothetical protein
MFVDNPLSLASSFRIALVTCNSLDEGLIKNGSSICIEGYSEVLTPFTDFIQ